MRKLGPIALLLMVVGGAACTRTASSIVITSHIDYKEPLCDVVSIADFGKIAGNAKDRRFCFAAKVYSATDGRLVLVAPSYDERHYYSERVYITSSENIRLTNEQMRRLQVGANVIVNGFLEFDEFCWGITIPKGATPVCAPVRYPVTLLRGDIAAQ